MCNLSSVIFLKPSIWTVDFNSYKTYNSNFSRKSYKHPSIHNGFYSK